MLHSFTAYFPLLQDQFGWSRTQLAGAFSLSRAESGLLGPIQGWLIEKFGPRAVIRLGVLMLGTGFMLFSRIDSVLSYYLTFALMAIGSSLATYLTVSSTVVNWFIKRRALAIGLTLSGFGFGGLLVPVVAWSLLTFGWRPTAFYSGVVIILIGMPIAQIMRRTPEHYGYLPDGEVANDTDQMPGSHLADDVESCHGGNSPGGHLDGEADTVDDVGDQVERDGANRQHGEAMAYAQQPEGGGSHGFS